MKLLRILVVLVAGLVPATSVVAQIQSDPPRQVDGKTMSILVRTTMVAVDHANKTGNYTVLRDLGARSFQEINDPVRLADIFRPIREAKLNLSEAVLIDPALDNPRIDRNGLLNLEGFVPLKPLAPIYRFVYRWEKNAWRLFSISVGADKLESILAKRKKGANKKPASKKSSGTGN